MGLHVLDAISPGRERKVKVREKARTRSSGAQGEEWKEKGERRTSCSGAPL